MDADGLEILDGFRAAGVPAASILMGPADYDAWERFGTNVDKDGKPLGPRPPRPVPHLNEDERTLYQQLVSPGWTRQRRVEQERIPLRVALARVEQPVELTSAVAQFQADSHRGACQELAFSRERLRRGAG